MRRDVNEEREARKLLLLAETDTVDKHEVKGAL